MTFLLPVDIVNRGLVHLGKERIRNLTEHSVNALEGSAAYDNLRLAELRRAVWTFATRRVILRAVDDDTVVWTPGAYVAATTYAHGAVVSYDNSWWESQVAANLGNTPATGAYWQHYYGAVTANPFDDTTSYSSGELVVGSDDAVYRSLVNANENDPVAVGTGWLALGGTTLALAILYPLGAGPSGDTTTRNIFHLPRGFLRRAPTNPKAGVSPYLGGPVNQASEDWVFEGGYIVSSAVYPIMLRYVADVTDVSSMDPMFCEMLAARIAEEVGPRVLDGASAADKAQMLSNVRSHYRTERSEAIMVNGIDKGPTESWEDDYITVRY